MSMVLVNPYQAGNSNSVYLPITLTNPGAELGNTTGWTNETGAIGVRSASPAAHTGTYYFYGGTVASSIARQRVDLLAAGWTAGQLDAGNVTAYLSWWFGTYDSDADNGAMGLRALDVSQVAIGADDYATSENVNAWVYRTKNKLLPTGTRYVDILMKCTRAGGTNNDAYFDDIALVTRNY